MAIGIISETIYNASLTPTVTLVGTGTVVVVMSATVNPPRVLNSITLDGVAGTVHHNASLDGGKACSTAIAYWPQIGLCWGWDSSSS